MKSIYENLGGTYKANSDYRLPTLALPKEEQFEIGMWGQRYRRHLKENHRIIYYNYLTKGTLNKHLAEIDTRAEKKFQQLVKSLAEKENVTESLKAKDKNILPLRTVSINVPINVHKDGVQNLNPMVYRKFFDFLIVEYIFLK